MPVNEEDPAYRYKVDSRHFAIIQEWSGEMNYVVINLATMKAGHVAQNLEHPEVMICLNCSPGGDCVHVQVTRKHLKALDDASRRPRRVRF